MSGEFNQKRFGREIKPLERMRSVGRSAAEPVSYTHLTLPTKLEV